MDAFVRIYIRERETFTIDIHIRQILYYPNFIFRQHSYENCVCTSVPLSRWLNTVYFLSLVSPINKYTSNYF